jgi:hypothetical protein
MSYLRHSGAGPSVVIPAKAGIQQKEKLRVAGKAVVPLMKQLAIRLSWQKTPAKSLVMCGEYSMTGFRVKPGMTARRVA